MLELNTVSAGYAGFGVLEGISLRVAEGEFVGILGRNGVGKGFVARGVCSGPARKVVGCVNGCSPRGSSSCSARWLESLWLGLEFGYSRIFQAARQSLARERLASGSAVRRAFLRITFCGRQAHLTPRFRMSLVNARGRAGYPLRVPRFRSSLGLSVWLGA